LAIYRGEVEFIYCCSLKSGQNQLGEQLSWITDGCRTVKGWILFYL